MNITATGQSLLLFRKFFDARTATQSTVKKIWPKDVLPIRPAVPIETASPESEGISSSHIEKFIRELAGNADLNIHDLLLIRNGRLLAKVSFGAQNADVPKYTFSACKSIVMLAIGMLVDDGLLKLNEKICDIFNDECMPLTRVRTKQVTVEHMLAMKSGLIYGEFEAAGNDKWLYGALNGGTRGEPGAEFSYNSMNTYILAAIVNRKTGKQFSEFIDERLFSKLGITDWFWESCPDDYSKGGWGLYIRPEDLAKIGIFIMNDGVWNGERLISSDFLDMALTTKAETPASYGQYNYGFQVWVGQDNDTFLFNGLLGQNMLGYRDNGILIATNAGQDCTFQQSAFFTIADKYFSGRFPDAIPEDEDAKASLEDYIASLPEYNNKKELPSSGKKAVFAGKTFIAADEKCVSVGLLPGAMQALENNYTAGVKKISVLNNGDCLDIVYDEGEVCNTFSVGFDRPKLCTLTFKEQKYLAAVQGRITHDDEENPVLRVNLDFIETPFSRVIKIVLCDGQMVLKQSEIPGSKYVLNTFRHLEELQPGSRIMSAVLGSIDTDYAEFKINGVLSPEVRFEIGQPETEGETE